MVRKNLKGDIGCAFLWMSILFWFSSLVYAGAYMSVLVLEEGSQNGQIGIGWGDNPAYDQYPWFKVDYLGNVILGDFIFGRIQIFSPDGELIHVIQPEDQEEAFLFPHDFLILTQNRLITTSYKGVKIYSYSGQQLAASDTLFGVLESTLGGDRILISQEQKNGPRKYIVLDNQLNVILSSQERPLELGKYDYNYYDKLGSLHNVMRFPDRCYAFINHGGIQGDFKRLGNDLYVYTDSELWILGDNNQPRISVGFMKERLEQSRLPVIGQDGEVYILRGLSDGVAIIKFNLSELPPAEHTVIAESNTPPVFDHVSVQEILVGDDYSISIHATDADGDKLVYSASNLPQGATFDVQQHIFVWSPVQGQEGEYSVAFKVEDTKCAQDEMQIEFRVKAK